MNVTLRRKNGINKMQYVSWSSSRQHTIDGYALLAIKVVRYAANDYKKELIKSKKDGVKTREAYRLERFFRSEYGQMLSFGMGEYIIEQIQKEVEKSK